MPATETASLRNDLLAAIDAGDTLTVSSLVPRWLTATRSGKVWFPADPANDNARLTSFTARDLMTMDFPPVNYVVPGYIAEGCTILAGASKLGKSWLMLQIADAVATGSRCLGGQCEPGDVLYLALEDNPRRLKERLQKQNGAASITGKQMPERLHFETEWPRADLGGLAKIESWLKDHPGARLVIIDVLKMFRAQRKGNKNAYDVDYEDIGPLSQLAGRYKVAIVIVHHTNKGAFSSDPFDRVNGTGGISGAADTTLILARNESGVVELYGRGRDIEEIETAISFDKLTCTWSVRGNAAEVAMSDTAAKIVRALREAEGPMGPREISKACRVVENTVSQHLPRLATEGKIEKIGRGQWAIAGNLTRSLEPPSDSSETSDSRAPNIESDESYESDGEILRASDSDDPDLTASAFTTKSHAAATSQNGERA